MKLLKLLYEVLLDWINDLKETRKQLVFIGTALFVWCVFMKVETSVLLTVAGLLTIVYTFFFQSNNQRFKQDHEKYIIENTKTVLPNRDPDNIGD